MNHLLVLTWGTFKTSFKITYFSSGFQRKKQSTKTNQLFYGEPFAFP